MQECRAKQITLVAVSKTKPIEDINILYNLGHRDFGENYVQELVDKRASLPADIRWHFIGHLQSNKVKYIAPFVYMIHGVDSLKLLQEINKQGARNSRKINCLLQVYIAREETKFGLDESELTELLDVFSGSDDMEYVRICGLMAMSSFTDQKDIVRNEFRKAKQIYDATKEHYYYHEDQFREISMGMSGDYLPAIEEGSTMIRIGSLIFGERSQTRNR
jgi:PLP dependent protein